MITSLGFALPDSSYYDYILNEIYHFLLYSQLGEIPNC